MDIDTSDKRLAAIETEISLINVYVTVSNDETLVELLLLRKDVLDNELVMILDARVHEENSVQRAIDQLLGEI